MSTIDPDRAGSVADSERVENFALRRIDQNYVTLVAHELIQVKALLLQAAMNLGKVKK